MTEPKRVAASYREASSKKSAEVKNMVSGATLLQQARALQRFVPIVLVAGALVAASSARLGAQEQTPSFSQQAAATAEAAPSEDGPLSSDELEVLVSRIALYPDEMVAAILAASLYPVQIVQAQRYLDQVKSKPELKPDSDWDGSVVSLLNYPEIVKWMSEDLDWTEQISEAITNQQKDVLEAIQQLRDRAVAKKVIKSDEKTKVIQQNDTVIIQPAKADEIYVPVYEPQMLYEPDYVAEPVSYYPEPYPSYYYPTAPYFAGIVTGAFWGAVIDWDDWDVWGGDGPWDNDIDIDCNDCFNNRDFNGKLDWNDVDWSNIDRSKISFDRSKFANFDRNKLKDGLRANDRNSLRNKARDLNRNRPSTLPSKGGRQGKDVRKSTLEGLKQRSGSGQARNADRQARQGDRQARQGDRQARPRDASGSQRQAGAERRDRPGQSAGNRQGAGNRKAQRPSAKAGGKRKPAARADNRPKRSSPMGDISRGRNAKSYSNRGGRSMGGGAYRGGGGQKFRYHGGGRSMGGRGGRGGGGRRR